MLMDRLTPSRQGWSRRVIVKDKKLNMTKLGISKTKTDTKKLNGTNLGGGKKIVKPEVLVRFWFSLPMSLKDFSFSFGKEIAMEKDREKNV